MKNIFKTQRQKQLGSYTKKLIPHYLKTHICLNQGSCTYVKKASNAELSGAYAVIVAHNDPKVNIVNIIPVSDSKYTKVEIPIILISQRNGLEIMETLKVEASDVIISVDIDLEGKQSKVVRVEYWLNTGNHSSYNFLVQMQAMLESFGDSVEFTPKFKYENYVTKSKPKSFLKKHCYSKGRFCQIENSAVNPLDLVEEGIRQACLWRGTNSALEKNKTVKSAFWKYADSYRKCLHNLRFGHSEKLTCKTGAYDDSGMEESRITYVEQCQTQSFADSLTPFDSENDVLIENENGFMYSEIYLVPALFINDQLMKEDLSVKSATTAICDMFEHQPAYCQEFLTPKRDFQTGGSVRDSMKGLLFLVIVSSICLLIVILLCLKRSVNKGINREVYHEVNQYVSSYMRMKK